ncbi:hypothetical protein [Streptosporangium sandarakinum]|uniref:hypothetical protein n=1 Tax=Streptosporangium sandarakinum TaxID=1260955 RepID=UPI00342D1BE4
MLNDEACRRTDDLGWRTDDAVASVLEAAATDLAAGPHPVILENFPGNLPQLDLIHDLSRRHRLALGVLELTADDEVVTRRVRERRVCPRCEPDLHAPASVKPGEVLRCALCGTPVLCRDTDDPLRHALRLRRYRDRLGDLAAQCRARGLAYASIDASRAMDEVHADAMQALSKLTVPSEPSLFARQE